MENKKTMKPTERKMSGSRHETLGGGFNFFKFSPILGNDSHFDEYFSKGLKPPTR